MRISCAGIRGTKQIGDPLAGWSGYVERCGFRTGDRTRRARSARTCGDAHARSACVEGSAQSAIA